MDGFSLAQMIIAVVVAGGALMAGAIGLLRARTSRRERLEMKQHLRRTGLSGGGMNFHEN
jgi:hypothetical protein